MKRPDGAHRMSTDYWRLVEPVWDSITRWDEIPAFLSAFGSTEPTARTLFAAHWLYSEVCNGGFRQFFWNSTGILAPEAADAYDALGMLRTGDVIRRSMSWFPSPYPREREVRMDLLDGHAQAHPDDANPFVALDEEFDDAAESEGGGFVRSANAFASRSLPEGDA
jgi:hypothetical protein